MTKNGSYNKDHQSKIKINDIFPVVAIGASAGGLEAFEQFFKQIPAKTGMAYVVLTHLDRDHISIMADLLKKYTPMPVFTIIDGVTVEPDTIYVIPPRKNVSINDGVLSLVEQDEPHYSNLPINFFFRSLSQEMAEHAVAIVLSGAGTDGSMGARDIKLNGGLVMAQEPATAKFDSMPSSVINTGFVDYILSPELMPEQLIKWTKETDNKDLKTSSDLQHIFSILRSRTGCDFSAYKLTTIRRRIEKQMLIHNVVTLADYVLILRKDNSAVDNLFKDFLIGVTRFFRDAEVFSVLQTTVLPKLLANKEQDYNLRVWVPGCSTGEEVYSIAIIIAEYMDATNSHYHVQIFGTDIDRNALMTARVGVYAEAIEHDMSPERLSRYFTKEKNKYKVKKEIRSMVIFGEQNLIKDPPFTKVDIISCRNLLIYLNMKLQKNIIPMFHYSLRPNGVLMLGTSESIGSYHSLFEPLDKKHKLFLSKLSTNMRRSLAVFPRATRSDTFAFHSIKDGLLINENTETNQAINTLLLERYVAPCLVVNEDGDILYFRGDVERYIKPSPLPNKFNIANVAHHDIRNLLKSALTVAINKKEEVIYRGLSIKNHDELHAVNLRVVPIDGVKILQGMLIIIFEQDDSLDNVSQSDNEDHSSSEKKDKRLKKIERELLYTRENLQATIEELESSNEELQSLNEELQSTNEEIETSKEELHSMNEELMITNTELQSRIDQLAVVHDDMTNLFNSTEIATIFLDNKLNIKRYTPKAQEFIHLIASDVGRPISHFATTIKYEKLSDDAEEVLRTLHHKIVEVQGKSGRWFLVRILPYRTVANLIDGVVITLTDITEHKISESKLSQLNTALNKVLSGSRNIIDAVTVPLMVLEGDLKIASANRAFYKYFQLLPEDVIGRYVYDISGWDNPELRSMLEKKFPNDILFEGFELQAKFLNKNHQSLKLNARKIFNNGDGEDMILLAMEPL